MIDREFLQRVMRLVPYMDTETQMKLLALVRETRVKLAAVEGGGLPASAVSAMVEAVPDKLMADIVKDLRKGPGEPGWIKPERSEHVVRGTGWQSPAKPEDRSRQFAMFDQMVEAMVGGPNDTRKLR